MKSSSSAGRAILDIGLVASLVAMFAVMVKKHAFSAPVHGTLLFGLMLAATALGWAREARRERRLDELELASESFGARWSAAVLSAVALLLLFVAPLQDAIVWFDQAYEGHESRPLPAPVGVFLCGFIFAVALHLTAKSVLASTWTWTKR